MKLSEVLPRLTERFPPEAHRERDVPGGGRWFYIPWQIIRDRLNQVCPDDWEVSYDEPRYLDKYCYVTCTLMICGVTRRAIGSAQIELISSKGNDMARGNPIERAVADAFKNAAEAFGIAAYLDDQADPKTKADFANWLHKHGNSKAATEYRRQELGETRRPTPDPAPKPFGQSAKPARTVQSTVSTTAQPDSTPITTEQVKRFWGIARTTGYTDGGVRALLGAWGFTSSKEITRNAYDGICEKAADVDLKEIYNQRAEQSQVQPVF
jgi:hypothetical protein